VGVEVHNCWSEMRAVSEEMLRQIRQYMSELESVGQCTGVESEVRQFVGGTKYQAQSCLSGLQVSITGLVFIAMGTVA